MSNNPNKKQMTDEEFELFYSELFDEFGPKDHDEDYLKDSPVKNVPSKNPQQPRQTAAQQAASRQAAARRYQAGPEAYGGNLDAEQPKTTTPKKEKGIRGLVILACAECLGIVGVVLWWVLRIL